MITNASDSESRPEQPWKVYLLLMVFAAMAAAAPLFITWPRALDGYRPFKLQAFARATLLTQQYRAEKMMPLDPLLLDAAPPPLEQASQSSPPALPCLHVTPAADPRPDQEAPTGFNGTLPPGFDWQAYLYWHPKLRGNGVASEAAAERHYMQEGRAQGLMFKRYHTVLVYGGFGGLMNQVYGHIAAILLARAMGADLVLASAMHRDTFNAGMSKTPWKAAPADSILDVDAIVEHWRKRGLVILKDIMSETGHELRRLLRPCQRIFKSLINPLLRLRKEPASRRRRIEQFEEMLRGKFRSVRVDVHTMSSCSTYHNSGTRPLVFNALEIILSSCDQHAVLTETAVEPKFWLKQDNTSTLQLEGRPPLDMRSRVKLSTLKRPDFGAALTAIEVAIVQQTEARLLADPGLVITDLVVHLSNCFWIFPLRDMPKAHEVAQSLRFAPPIIEIAGKILRNITDGSGTPPNGLHYRLEGDAKSHHLYSHIGGEQGVWGAYATAMKQANFSNDVPLYVASGLLTYGDTAAMNNSIHHIISSGFASKVFFKEHFLEKQVLEGLKSEQSALVDFLVLANCSTFVGFGRSSFSYFLQQYKALHKYPSAVSVMVGDIPSDMKNFATVP